MNCTLKHSIASLSKKLEYSPFGMRMSQRSSNSSEYRYGFNGMETDGEIKGEGNSYDFGARIYDPRIGRWLAVDPEQRVYAAYTPYNFVLNTPLQAIDPDGKRTYFIGGAGFNAKNAEKLKAKENQFTGKLLTLFSESLGDNFHMVESSNMGIFSAASGSIWSLNNGSKPILEFTNHKELRNTVDEIVSDYRANASTNEDGSYSEPLNIIGSSYGSVVSAQAAIIILEENDDINITSLTLSASPVDPGSDLGIRLAKLKESGRIEALEYLPNENDNVTGAAGNSSVMDLIFPGKGNKSILNKNHPHNTAARDNKRAEEHVDHVLQYEETE